jgi:hypothetical protein
LLRIWHRHGVHVALSAERIAWGHRPIRRRVRSYAVGCQIQPQFVTRNVRSVWFDRIVIDSEKAALIEERLASMLNLQPREVRDYIQGRIRAGGRRTGYRFVRGTHGGCYVPDPEGTDILPVGFEASVG